MPKLRTYKTLKLDTGGEWFVRKIENRKRRSLLAKTRIGTLPINIETGRYRQEPVEERTCPHCKEEIEDEVHFLISCPLYNGERKKLENEFMIKNNLDITEYTKEEELYLL